MLLHFITGFIDNKPASSLLPTMIGSVCYLVSTYIIVILTSTN